ncbi:MAG: hypothetical protein HC819_23840 [Cyclobacteriaceae bacterium]|nr:hypothetical protein [Cyclobacteriaceae bacterium]
MTDAKKDDSTRVTFLHEAQQEGRASGEMKVDLDQAIQEITHIMNDSAMEAYKNKSEEEWPTTKMAIYCHDCRTVVPAGMGKSLRGNPRTVCGICNSKKISMGREEALRSFYQLDENNHKKQKHGPHEEKEGPHSSEKNIIKI